MPGMESTPCEECGVPLESQCNRCCFGGDLFSEKLSCETLFSECVVLPVCVDAEWAAEEQHRVK